MSIALHHRMLVLALGVTLAVVVTSALIEAAPAALADPDGPSNTINAGPPNTVNTTDLWVNSCGTSAPFSEPVLNPFPVRIDISGKGKTIETFGGDTTIFTSPGKRATLTNLDYPSEQVSYVITGVYHQTQTELADDDEGEGDVVEIVTTGRTLLFGPDFGILAIGRFTFIYNDEEGTYVTQPTGNGRIINVCSQLESE
jgi:hypothetical protein